MAAIWKRGSPPHPALKLSSSLSTDIFPGLFDWFFTHNAFRRWSERKSPWQLHCIGGPGSGKTTIATLVYRHLRDKYHSNGCPTVAVYFQNDIYESEAVVFEDFLVAVYEKLGDSKVIDNDLRCEEYERYVRHRSSARQGRRRTERLNLIRKAIHWRLAALKEYGAFLILDGVDRCNGTLRILIDQELSDLHSRGLGIFLTSRIAVFENIITWCDHPEHHGAYSLDMFLECKVCEGVLCFPCKEANRRCDNCDDNSNLHEPNDYVNIRLNIPFDAMRDYINWGIEREHGDLGLNSQARKPPLSALGKALCESQTPKPAEKYANRILEDSVGNISMAKARLDLLHEAQSIADLEVRRDRLPPNIVELFSSGMKQIAMQTQLKRELAWKSFAMAAQDGEGASVPELHERLRDFDTYLSSGEDILEASKGFLLATTAQTPQRLFAYHRDFIYYASEWYNLDIHRAMMQLNGNADESESMQHDGTDVTDGGTRFEPANVSGEPAEVTSYKLARTTTTLERIDEGPAKPFIIRAGTREWR